MENKVKNQVISWNNRFPIDLWWRKKHNIAFMSKQHRSISFLDQLFEYEEDRLYNEAVNQELKEKGLIHEEDTRPHEERILDMKNEFEEFLREQENG